ncbi:MAG: signal peptidase I [Gemmatimonadetes bacterium]|nr:signal peptidase I [Gemmatimonadota bacterium]|tara:strand:+ start:351 stop:1049 length:699 start_codon:yes stop_codon:yes gene_type:complete
MGKKPVQRGRASARRSVGRGKKRSKVFGLLLIIPMVIGVFYLFVATLYRVPSRAMEDTLHVGDYLLVDKLHYGPQLPFGLGSLPGLGKVEAGDLIVFQLPEDPDRVYIKRCIATSGQVVEIIDKAAFVDGLRVADPPYSKYIDARIRLGSNSTRDNLSPVEVPEGSLFLIGDNRDNSRDSRNWGTIPQQYVLGRGLAVMFSVRPKEGELSRLESLLDFPLRVRWSRIGMWLQ